MPISLNSQNIYEIKVYGQLDEPWLGSIGAAETYTAILDDNSQVTTISNVILDQAGMIGLSSYQTDLKPGRVNINS